MLLAILFLLDFCTFCNLMWLLPLLLISWLLGWLYEWLKRQVYIDRIEALESDYKRHTAKITALEKELAGVNYELEKSTNDYNQVRSNNADLDEKLRSCTEQQLNLEAELIALREYDPSEDEGGNSSIDDAVGLYTGGAVEDGLGEPSTKIEIEEVTQSSKAGFPQAEIPMEGTSIEEEPLVTQAEETVLETEEHKQGVVAENLEQPKENERIQVAPPPITADLEEELVPEVPEVPEALGFGALFASDDLKIIEGVGTKIEGLLKAAGYTSWSKMGAASFEDLEKVLEDAGPRYRVHNPKTWSEQASLAANGDWDALINYQKFLDTGRDDASAKGGTPSKIEKLYAKKIGLASFKPNDLKIVEGIGPKIAGLLKDAGIDTWAALANSPVSKIQDVLNSAGSRYRLANPKTWPKQAELAHQGKWPELKAYQDFLDGGRE